MSLAWETGTNPSESNVNTEKTATITFDNGDVRAVYIDWDDGASNKKDEANYQWVELTEPKKTITVKHTYTKTGDFNPIIQTINSDGFVSRYYSPAANTEVVPHSINSGIAVARISDLAPTAIMRVENTTMNSGIDNSILETEGPQKVYIAIAPTLTLSELRDVIKQVNVTVEGTIHRNKYDAATGTEAQLALGTDVQHEAITMEVNFASKDNGLVEVGNFSAASENGAWGNISKVTYDSCKGLYTTDFNAADSTYNQNEPFNRLKIFLVVKAADGNYYPITYVTAGSPVKSVDDNTRYSALNMGQSRAAASNVAISNYRYDNGKVWFSPVNQWSLSTNILGTGTQISNSVKPIHYSYLVNPDGLNNIAAQEVFGTSVKWYYHTDNVIQQDSTALDDYGRFFPQYHNVRNSVVAASNSGSLITTNQPEVLLVAPSSDWDAQNPIDSKVDSFTTQMKNNGSSNVFKLANINTQAVTDIKGAHVSADAEQEYIILTFDSKTNKVFFNSFDFNNFCSNLAPCFCLTAPLPAI